MIKDMSLNFKAGAMNFFYYMCYCGAMLYLTSYLIYKGFNTAQIGILLFVSNILGASLQNILAIRADEKGGSILIRQALIQLGGVVFLMASLIVWDMPKTYIYVAYLVIAMLLMSVQTSLYSISVAYESLGKALKFSILRGVGSLGFAVTSLCLGNYLVGKTVDKAMPVAIVGGLLTILSLSSLPAIGLPGKKIHKESGDDRGREKLVKQKNFYKKYPIFINLFIAYILLYSGHVFLNNYLAQIVKNVGGDTSNLGMASTLAALCEMPAMFLYSRFRKWRSDRFWLTTSGICFTVKIGILALAKNMFWINFSQAMNFCTFGFFTPAYVYFANNLVDEDDMVKGQSIGLGAVSVGGAAGSIIGGTGMHILGVSGSLALITVFSALGSIFLAYSLYFKQFKPKY